MMLSCYLGSLVKAFLFFAGSPSVEVAWIKRWIRWSIGVSPDCTARMNILLADDDSIVRKVLRKILESNPEYVIRESVDGLDCWQTLDEGFMPDLCLLDIEMPNMTGLELLERMRGDARFRDLPVLMITSRTDVNSKASAAALSSYAFVIKPFNPKKVLSLVKEATSSGGKVFHPYGFEERDIVLKREGMDATGYFKAMVYFVEMLGLRLDPMERNLANANFEQLLNVIQPLKEVSQQVGGTLYSGYFNQIEAIATDSETEELALSHGARHIRMLRAEYVELKQALENYLQVVIESDSKQKIVTQPDMTDWEGESIRLSAEVEEHFFDSDGWFSLGNESIVLRGFRGSESIMLARLQVKDGRIVVSSLDDKNTAEMEIDLSAFVPEVADAN